MQIKGNHHFTHMLWPNQTNIVILTQTVTYIHFMAKLGKKSLLQM